jgi:hypothetical protein
MHSGGDQFLFGTRQNFDKLDIVASILAKMAMNVTDRAVSPDPWHRNGVVTKIYLIYLMVETTFNICGQRDISTYFK